MVGMLIVLNNYLHDVATAVLLSSAVILFVLGRQARRGGEGERVAFARAYKTLTRFAIGALVWIILGGIPRTIFFTKYEFIPAQMNGIVPDLIMKHVILVTMVVVGGVMWVRLGRFAREIAAGDERPATAGDGAR
jgi:hypothetical protein